MRQRITTLTLILCLLFTNLSEVIAFCGFYVAKADSKLFNESSQLIVARSGQRTTITMANDFKGDVKDFAMIVPVPDVLKKENIRLVYPSIFEKLDSYSSPRLVEYEDDHPCEPKVEPETVWLYRGEDEDEGSGGLKIRSGSTLGVAVEAKYSIGEYQVLILSAKESSGLHTWLKENGYKIPANAKEVLDPYVKNGLKFFVVKVNLEEVKDDYVELKPLQITYDYHKFMVPIRLGMANSKHDQDLVIYAFSEQGRIETANYRTIKMPTDHNVPEFVEGVFGDFYSTAFTNTWEKGGKDAVFLEYGWDLSSKNYVKCDPCVTEPPLAVDLQEAGVDWLDVQTRMVYTGDVYMTRLHLRYNRETFPQDLEFQETPNTQNFQARYVVNHPATGNLSCEAGKKYTEFLTARREEELRNLTELTGWKTDKLTDYVTNTDFTVQDFLSAKLLSNKEEGNKYVSSDQEKHETVKLNPIKRTIPKAVSGPSIEPHLIPGDYEQMDFMATRGDCEPKTPTLSVEVSKEVEKEQKAVDEKEEIPYFWRTLWLVVFLLLGASLYRLNK